MVRQKWGNCTYHFFSKKGRIGTQQIVVSRKFKIHLGKCYKVSTFRSGKLLDWALCFLSIYLLMRGATTTKKSVVILNFPKYVVQIPPEGWQLQRCKREQTQWYTSGSRDAFSCFKTLLMSHLLTSHWPGDLAEPHVGMGEECQLTGETTGIRRLLTGTTPSVQSS